MTKPKTSPWTYVGGHDAVEICFSGGRTLLVARGETVELVANEAKAIAKNPAWTQAKTKKEED